MTVLCTFKGTILLQVKCTISVCTVSPTSSHRLSTISSTLLVLLDCMNVQIFLKVGEPGHLHFPEQRLCSHDSHLALSRDQPVQYSKVVEPCGKPCVVLTSSLLLRCKNFTNRLARRMELRGVGELLLDSDILLTISF